MNPRASLGSVPNGANLSVIWDDFYDRESSCPGVVLSGDDSSSLGSVLALKHLYLLDKDIRIRVTIVFDELGRQESVANGVATSTFTYTAATLALDTETITYNLPSQPAFTRVIDRSRYNLGRDSGWQLKKCNTIENQAEYEYSATDGRLFKVLGLASSR
jgi:hypothetical protein